MAAKLHVTNLSQTITNSDLHRLFAAHGNVREARVLIQGGEGGAGGTGLVEMTSTEEGDAAIAALNGRAYRGHLIAVAWATLRQANCAADGLRMFGSMNMPDASEDATASATNGRAENCRDEKTAAADGGRQSNA